MKLQCAVLFPTLTSGSVHRPASEVIRISFTQVTPGQVSPTPLDKCSGNSSDAGLEETASLQQT